MSKEKFFVDEYLWKKLLELGVKCVEAGGDTIEMQLPEIDGIKTKVEISFYWEDKYEDNKNSRIYTRRKAGY